ncbi:uncharacterized protein LOC126878811 [Diabrotica virgifera virgifera]|uniref:Reverse transcriptase domain-containing protein n=1 Tax=Diabrotica virgifera virgifera TaxID=50390 RepID=A0ABM5JIA8_DIAVI|nr:uncharacterized protein LOC126878811 [Diabrotica virgifera virgifera]
MGSSLSPIMCNYALDDLIEECLKIIPFHIPFVKRFVDDLILAVPNDKINEVLNIFNNQCSQLQFTAEREQNNSLPFLDMLVHRTQDNSLKTEWYRKPISSNRFINYYSEHPTRTKIKLILGLKSRVIKISHPTYREKSLKRLKNILMENSYPVGLLNKLIFSTATSPASITLIDNTNNKKPPTVNMASQERNTSPTIDTLVPTTPQTFGSLPYIPFLTPKLLKLFKGLENIKIATRNVKTIAHLYTKTKDPLTTKESSKVVYQIPCSDCDKVYIGETSRTLHSRIISHRSDINTKKKIASLCISRSLN